MGRVLKWLGIAVGLGLVCMAGAAFALHRWVNTDDFRQRVEGEASAVLGVPLRLGKLSVEVWPLPAVAVDQLRVQSQPPVTLERVEARPVWNALLAGRIEVGTLVVRDAVVPQQGVNAILAAIDRKQPKGAKPQPGSAASDTDLTWIPRRALLQKVTWVDDKGARTTVDAEARLAPDGFLQSATFKILQGRLAGTEGKIDRAADHWPLHVKIGGGTIVGKLRLQRGQGNVRVLSGQFDTDNVELAALTAPSKTLTGKLQAHTTLKAEFKDPAQLAEVMTSSTRFTVRNAVVHGLDLQQAVKTAGLQRGGETRLDALAGQVLTQGRSVQLNNLVASSGALAATGNVAMAASKALNGRVTVELAGTRGSLGVPLAVGGTLDAPSVTLTQGALIGAAIGTVLAPGLGTGAGASAGGKIGEKLKGLFGR